jgi:hypothetical protein
MELRVNRFALLIMSVLYLILFQLHISDLHYIYGFSLGFVFFDKTRIRESLIYVLISIFWLFFGHSNEQNIIPITLMIINLYIYKMYNGPKLKNYLHLLLIFGFFLTLLPNTQILPEFKDVCINLISIYSLFKIDELKESPLSYMYVALSIFSVVLNITFIYSLLFFLLVFMLNKSWVSFLRLLILLILVFVKIEFNLDMITTTLIVSLLAHTILSLSISKDLYIAPMMLSLFFIQKHLTVEYLIMFVTIIVFCEVFQSKRELNPC